MTTENITNYGDDGDDGDDGLDGGDATGVAGGDGTDGLTGDDGEATSRDLGALDPSTTSLQLHEGGGYGGYGGYGGDAGSGTPGGHGGSGGIGGDGGADMITGHSVVLDDLFLLSEGGTGGDGGGSGLGGDGETAANADGGHGGDGGDAGAGGLSSIELYGGTLGDALIVAYGGDGGFGGGDPTVGDGGGGVASGTGTSGQGGAGGNAGDGGDGFLLLDGITFTAAEQAFAAAGGAGGYGGAGGASLDGTFNGKNGDSGYGGDATLLVVNNSFAFGDETGVFPTPATIRLAAAAGVGLGGLYSSYTQTLNGGTADSSSDGHGGDGGNAALVFQDNDITGTSLDEDLDIDVQLISGEALDSRDPGDTIVGDHGANGTATLTFSGNMIDGGDGNDTLLLSGLTFADDDSVDVTAPHRTNEIFAITINLATHLLNIGGQINTVVNVENVDLSEQRLNPDAWTAHTYASTVSLTGTTGDNSLTASQGDDLLRGMDGNDVLDGWLGVDRMYGGAGDDTYYVDNAADRAYEYTGDHLDNGGTDTVHASVTYTIGDYVENLTLDGVDDLTGYGNSLDNDMLGNDGINILKGYDGNDTLDGGLGADRLYGGAGNDAYYVDDAGDRAYEYGGDGLDTGGTDTVIASVTFTLGNFIEGLDLATGAGDINGYGNGLGNEIQGNEGANLLKGYGGNDSLIGGAGADRMYGGAGDDSYYVDDSGDRAYEYTGDGLDNGGTDTVFTSVTFTLGNFVENMVLATGAGAIKAYGNDIGNNLTGNASGNVLNGKGGDDVLTGSAGNDSLTGGDGIDSFVFGAAGSANGVDFLQDFATGIDHLVFTATDYGFTSGHLLTGAELTFGARAVGSGAQFVYNAAKHELYWDTNGSVHGGMTAIAFFDNDVAPAASDFFFV